MTKREKIRGAELEQLETEFRSLLIPCLEKCASGRWGLFGQNDSVDPEGRYWNWPEATRLKELAREIEAIHKQFGTQNEDCDELLRLCSLRGSNISGESKLAAEFLHRLSHKSHS